MNPKNIRPTPIRFLPSIFHDVPVWFQNFANAIKETVENIVLNPNPPARPTNFVAATFSFGILLSWDLIQNATGYRLYRNTTANFDTSDVLVEVTGITNHTFVDVTTAAGDYYYWIQGVNASWVGGPISDLIKITSVSGQVGGDGNDPNDIPTPRAGSIINNGDLYLIDASANAHLLGLSIFGGYGNVFMNHTGTQTDIPIRFFVFAKDVLELGAVDDLDAAATPLFVRNNGIIKQVKTYDIGLSRKGLYIDA